MMRKTVLSNGVRLLTIPKRETPSLTALILFPVGSRQESPAVYGVSHYIEHMMFKGTKRRPKSLDISRELDAVGAEYNAFTGKDHTGYYVRIDAKHFNLAVDILSDMVINSLFDPQEMEREKKVIIEEIKMYEDNPTMAIEDVFEESLFGIDNALGHNIAGTRQTVSGLQRSAVLAYRNRFYIPSNLVVAVAGLLPTDVKQRVNRAFKSLGKKTKSTGYARVRPQQKSPRVRLRYKDTQQAHLALGFPGLAYADKAMPALMLLANILGGNMSSRLFVRIREELGLAYMVRASVGAYQDTGSLVVEAGLDKGRGRQAVTEILGVLRKIRDEGVTPAELKMAKDNLAGKIGLELENSEFVAAWYGKQEALLQTQESPTDRLATIQKVTLAQVNNVAKRLIRPAGLNLALIGPYRQTSEWLPILRRAL